MDEYDVLKMEKDFGVHNDAGKTRQFTKLEMQFQERIQELESAMCSFITLYEYEDYAPDMSILYEVLTEDKE